MEIDGLEEIAREIGLDILEDLSFEVQRIIRQDIEGTWENHYSIRVEEGPEHREIIWGETGTKVDLSGNFAPVPFYLNDGFTRHVQMSNTFIPKTAPGRLISGQGGGRRSPTGFTEDLKVFVGLAYDEQIATSIEKFDI